MTDHLLNLRKAIDRLYQDSGRTEAYMDALRELEAVDLELADARDRIDELALGLAAERRRAERQCLICFDHGDSGGAGRLVAVHERCLHELDRKEAGP